MCNPTPKPQEPKQPTEFQPVLNDSQQRILAKLTVLRQPAPTPCPGTCTTCKNRQP